MKSLAIVITLLMGTDVMETREFLPHSDDTRHLRFGHEGRQPVALVSVGSPSTKHLHSFRTVEQPGSLLTIGLLLAFGTLSMVGSLALVMTEPRVPSMQIIDPEIQLSPPPPPPPKPPKPTSTPKPTPQPPSPSPPKPTSTPKPKPTTQSPSPSPPKPTPTPKPTTRPPSPPKPTSTSKPKPQPPSTEQKTEIRALGAPPGAIQPRSWPRAQSKKADTR